MGATQPRCEGLAAALDIGTSKVAAVIAEVNPAGAKVIGVGTGFHTSLHRSQVTDCEALAKAVMEAVIKAERLAQVVMPPAVVGIPGSYCSLFTARGSAAIKRPGHRVHAADVARALDAACAVAIPPGWRIVDQAIHAYLLDGHRMEEPPIGRVGELLEVDVQFITASLSALRELTECLEQTGVQVDGMGVQCLAAARMVLSSAQRELGAALVDLGAGQTDIAVFRGGQLDILACLPVGTGNLARDLSAGLGISIEQAEQLVRRIGCAQLFHSAVGLGLGTDSSTRALLEDMQVDLRDYTDVFMARAEEIWQLVKSHIGEKRSGGNLAAGVRLAGGGALVPGMAALGSRILGMPVDASLPQSLKSLPEACQSPAYTAAVALVHEQAKSLIESQTAGASTSASLNVLWQKVRDWLKS
ncbi:MAG TPA: cell division protein FtsA [Firmicutes bacterium]|nr:cell division protein FtsA [Bacillota bacterium]